MKLTALSLELLGELAEANAIVIPTRIKGKLQLADYIAANLPNNPVFPRSVLDQLTQPKAVTGEVADIIGTAIQLARQGYVDESSIHEVIDNYLETRAPRRVEFCTDSVVTGSVSNPHPLLDKAVKLIKAGNNLALIGPAGTGKSTVLAPQIANALGVELVSVTGAEDLTTADYSGALLPMGEAGSFRFVPTAFGEAYQRGNALLLLDECFANCGNVLKSLNTAIQENRWPVSTAPNGYLKRGENVYFLAASNTFGTGSDFLYSAETRVDASFANRFYSLWVDYSHDYEKQAVRESVYTWINDVRKAVADFKLQRIVGTRDLLRLESALSVGIDWKECKRDFLRGWSRDELSRIGESELFAGDSHA